MKNNFGNTAGILLKNLKKSWNLVNLEKWETCSVYLNIVEK